LPQNQPNTNSSVLAPQASRSLLVKIAQELQENWSESPQKNATHKNHSKQAVLNGTGCVLNPTLGRSPLGLYVYEKLKPIIEGYCDFKLLGEPTCYLDELFETLVSEYKPVWVNNNVSAILLSLLTLKKVSGHKRVVVSRADMLEIDAGFRVGDVIAEAGLEVVEVGSVNHTRLTDYEDPLKKGGALVLKVASILSSQQTVSTQELVFLCRKWDMPIILNGGSFNIEQLKKMPTGYSMITCSTDKALGACQGGLILTQPQYYKNLTMDVLYRASQLDKIRVKILESVFETFVEKKEKQRLPYYVMLAMTPEVLKERAQVFEALRFKNMTMKVVACEANMGDGELVHQPCPSWGLQLEVTDKDKKATLKERLSQGSPYLVPMEHESEVIINLATILSAQDENLKKALLQLDASLDNS
jgi:L-seryl-tRNA(Ser) seleniumtransferase